MPLLILMAVVSIFVALFAVQNATAVSLSFLFLEFESSLAFVTIMSFFCGVLVASCYMLIMKAKQYIKDRKTQEEMTKLANEKAALETLVEYLKTHNGEMPQEEKPKQVVNPYIRN